MAQAITGAKSQRRGTTPAAAKMPAVTKRESPGRKKPTKNPVSTNTIVQTSGAPPLRMSSFSPSGSYSERKKWRIDSSTPRWSSPDSLWLSAAQARKLARELRKKRHSQYGNRKRQGRVRIRAKAGPHRQTPRTTHLGSSSHRLRQPQLTVFLRVAFAHAWPACQKLLYSWQSAACCCRARLYRLIGSLEIVPRQRLHIRSQHQVRVSLPDFVLMLLRRGDRPANYLENVAWRSVIPILHSYRNAQHKLRAQVACRARRHRRHQPAVCQTACSNLHRLKQSGKRAACAYRINQIAVRNDHRLAAVQIRGDHRHRDVQVLELPCLENTLDQVAQPVVARQAQPRDAPPRNVPQAQRPASSHDAGQRRTARIRCAQNAAHAGSRNTRNRYVVVFQHLKHAQVRKTAREASSQCQANSWPNGRHCPFERAELMVVRHAPRVPALARIANGSRVPKKQYGCTLSCLALKNGGILETVPSYYQSALAVPFPSAVRRAILSTLGPT